MSQISHGVSRRRKRPSTPAAKIASFLTSYDDRWMREKLDLGCFSLQNPFPNYSRFYFSFGDSNGSKPDPELMDQKHQKLQKRLHAWHLLLRKRIMSNNSYVNTTKSFSWFREPKTMSWDEKFSRFLKKHVGEYKCDKLWWRQWNFVFFFLFTCEHRESNWAEFY